MLLAGQAHPRHRRAQRRVDRVLGRARRAGAGRRGRAHARSAASMRLTERAAKRLPTRRPRSSSSTSPTRTTSTRSPSARRRPPRRRACTRSAFAPESCLGGGFLDAPWEDVAVALQVSAYSLKALAVAALPLMSERRLDRRARLRQRRAAWPVYDWMGVAKAAFESIGALPRPRPRPARDPRQPRRRRPAPHDRGQEHPRLRELRGGVGRARAARLGRQGRRAGRQGRASRCSPTGSRPPPARSIHVDGGFHAIGA